MSKAKFAAAKELIQEKRYAEAQAVLLTMPDDPTAEEWLAQLAGKVPLSTEGPAPQQPRSSRLRSCLVSLAFLVVIGGGGYYIGREAMKQEIRSALQQAFSAPINSPSDGTTPLDLTATSIVATNAGVAGLATQTAATDVIRQPVSLSTETPNGPRPFDLTATAIVATNTKVADLLAQTATAVAQSVIDTPIPTATPTATATATPTVTPTMTSTPKPLIFNDSAAKVIGPVEIPAGTYRAKMTTAKYITVSVTATSGECGAGTSFLSPGLFILLEGQATQGAEAVFTSKGCNALIEVSNVQAPWSLEFEKVS
jgi:hypothetical protein